MERSMARVIFSPGDRAHASADEFRLHRADVDLAPFEFACRGNQRVLKRSRCLRSPSAVPYRASESTNASGSEDSRSILFLINPVVEKHRQPRPRIHAEMMAALAADVKRALKIFLPDDLAAAIALQPEAFGAHVCARVVVPQLRSALRICCGFDSRLNQAIFSLCFTRIPLTLTRVRMPTQHCKRPVDLFGQHGASQFMRHRQAEGKPADRRARASGRKPSCPPTRKTRSCPSISAFAKRSANAVGIERAARRVEQYFLRSGVCPEVGAIRSYFGHTDGAKRSARLM